VDAPSIQYAQTEDGLSIAYWSIGAGPTLIFHLPSTISHIEQEWRTTYHRELYVALAQHFRVVRFDHRGVGLSDHSSTGYTASDLRLDLDAVLRATGSGPAVIASQAQIVAPILLALANPELISHFVFWTPFARGADWLALPTTALHHELRTVDPVRGTEAYVAPIAGLEEGGRASEYADMLRAVAASTDDGVRAAQYDFDIVDQLSEVAIPTLVLQPNESRMVPASLARQVAARIPGAELVMLDGDGPFPWIGWDEEYVSQLRRFILGEQAESVVDLTHTILFTDLASSTAITQRLGDAVAQDLVRAHNEIVRSALAAHGGHEVKHTGDGIFAWFPAASNGLDCAQAIQQGVADLANPDLGVKIGLNAGEPIAEEDDLYGTAVQIAARVTDQAGAGEIVCTDVVRLLVAGKSYLFSEREPAALKGVKEPVRLFTVGAGT
jgi:class 3 adenylate cyclase/pimeloyl-ACP methyl ester carboxylesterase